MSEGLKPSLYLIEAISEEKAHIDPLTIKDGKMDDYVILSLLYSHTTHVSTFESLEPYSSFERYVNQWNKKKNLGRNGFQFLIDRTRIITNVPILASEQVENSYSVWTSGRKCLRSCMDAFKRNVTTTPEREAFIKDFLPPFLSVIETEIRNFL